MMRWWVVLAVAALGPAAGLPACSDACEEAQDLCEECEKEVDQCARFEEQSDESCEAAVATFEASCDE